MQLFRDISYETFLNELEPEFIGSNFSQFQYETVTKMFHYLITKSPSKIWSKITRDKIFEVTETYISITFYTKNVFKFELIFDAETTRLFFEDSLFKTMEYDRENCIEVMVEMIKIIENYNIENEH